MREQLVFIGLVLALVVGAFFAFQTPDGQNPDAVSQASATQLEFSSLSQQNTNQCRGPEFLSATPDSESLQGSCCSPMDFHRYQEQLEGLKAYAGIREIPENPYNISVALAQKLLAYRDQIKLSPAQQSVYDDAVEMSHEGGPCCCKCWRWYAFEGLAKYLIVEQGFDAEKVADVWDVSDGCGGTGHAHGESGHAV